MTRWRSLGVWLLVAVMAGPFGPAYVAAQLVEPKARVTTEGGKDIREAQEEPSDGPKARVAVARFTDKTGKGWWTGSIGDGMADMLATSLFHTNRFIVLERQTLGDVLKEQDLAVAGRVKQETAAPVGEIEGAELLVTGAVTEFDPGAAGGGGGVGGFGGFGRVFGAIAGGFKRAHMAIDVRVIDTKTSRIVAATSVQGEATDVNLGALLGGASGGGALAGALGGWSNTPVEKALRITIQEAVKFIVAKTPATYYRVPSQGALAPSTAAPTGPPAAGFQPVGAPPPTAPQVAAPAPQLPPTPSAALPEIVYARAGAGVSLREGAGPDHKVITVLAKGTRLFVLDEKDRWYNVRTEDGKEGWVASWQTSVQP
ncbi:MAG: SH3 domain-containing protein [Candidatus Rokubacteria bacterium]|nr:SH3 domain-containing protein [Candidatus Rokubacteria bacterium]